MEQNEHQFATFKKRGRIKQFYSLSAILILSLLLPNCAAQQGFVYYENHQSSKNDINFLQSKSTIIKAHQDTLKNLKERRRRLIQSNNTSSSNTIAYTTTTTNTYNYIVQQDATNIISRNNNPSGQVNNIALNEIAALDLRIDEYERAIQQSKEDGYSKYQTIKVKVFPIEKVSGRIYDPYPWIPPQNFRNVTLENQNSFRVREVRIKDGKVVKDFGTFNKIDFELGNPTDQLSNNNKAHLYQQTSSSQPTNTIDLSKLAEKNEEEAGSDNFEATSLTLTPTKRPDDSTLVSNGTRQPDSDYLNAGFSSIKYQGSSRENGSGIKEHTYFYRGGFEIAYAHRYKNNPRNRRVWTVINMVDMEDYIYSVASKELGQATVSTSGAENARKAQVIASRTYAVLQADRARTGSVPRLFDLLPTTVNQVYLGVQAEMTPYKSAVANTKSEILGVSRSNGKARLASTHYFGCTDNRTIYPRGCQSNGKGCITELRPRIVPRTVSCNYAGNSLKTREDFEGQIVAYGHGEGMCQKCALHLATEGWDDTTRRPSQDSTYPENYTASWNHEHILKYFYNNSDIYALTDTNLE